MAAMAEHPAEAHGERPRIAFVGAGRVGLTLAVAFVEAGWPVTAAASRDGTRRQRFAEAVPGARTFGAAAAVLDEADVVFLTVPDDAVAGVARSLRLYSGQALVHTSGALPAGVLEPAMAAGTAAASFHPLVAFTDAERARSALRGATIALEGDEALLPLLAELAESIGARPVRLPAGTKQAHHAAAMMAAGGLVALLEGVARVARLAGIDEQTALRVYLPLARQTLANVEELGFDAALTGPFVRGDAGTVAGHLSALRVDAPELVPLYLALARREIAIAVRRGALSADSARELTRLLDEAEAADA